MEEQYAMYLNGTFYGSGNAKYMTELFKDYVEICGMYGNENTIFEVKKEE